MEESELIDKYLRGELDEQEQMDFTKQIQLDDTLKRRIALRRLIIEGVGLAYTDKLKQDLSAFDKSLDGKSRFKFSWKMAAVFAFLITAGAALYISVQKPNPLDFDIAEPGLPNVMGLTNDITFNNAMNIFKTGDFDTAGKQFNALLDVNHRNDTLLYFSGLCDFRTMRMELARHKWIQIDDASEFSTKAAYRLALTYWVQGDGEKAKELFRKVTASESGELRTESKKALDALE
ncbi:MAG: hypothetical protein KF725_02740 [Cyclobacteriaceae bacterium]|nr:hypothetical protein [Cyclobacteriaceae bacterium]UYN86646.1 MAG: hypothetical protein KIT51_17595 [Cyclobacteriaceae bacterium]